MRKRIKEIEKAILDDLRRDYSAWEYTCDEDRSFNREFFMGYRKNNIFIRLSGNRNKFSIRIDGKVLWGFGGDYPFTTRRKISNFIKSREREKEKKAQKEREWRILSEIENSFYSNRLEVAVINLQTVDNRLSPVEELSVAKDTAGYLRCAHTRKEWKQCSCAVCITEEGVN